MPPIADARRRLLDGFVRDTRRPLSPTFDYVQSMEHLYEFSGRLEQLGERGIGLETHDAIRLFGATLPPDYDELIDEYGHVDTWFEFYHRFKMQTARLSIHYEPNVARISPELCPGWVPKSQYLSDNPHVWKYTGLMTPPTSPPTSLVTTPEPTTVEEAQTSAEWPQWRTAMDDEIKALESSQVWTAATPPQGLTLVDSRWTFKRKLDAEGRVVGYKVQLTACNNEEAGIKANDTTAPVGRVKALRLLLAVAAEMDLELNHLDIDSTCLNTTLDQTVYMRMPNGVSDPSVVRLLKPIFGLRGRNHAWHTELKAALNELGFTELASEKSLYVRKNADGTPEAIIFAYVDSLLVASKSTAAAGRIAAMLSALWPAHDRGPVRSYLGFKLDRDRDTNQVWRSQSAYIDRLVALYPECERLKPRKVPIKLPEHAYEDKATPADGPKYCSLLGRLRWVANTTRADIAYAVSILSRFQNRPSVKQWMDALGVLSYLKNTRNNALGFGMAVMTDEDKAVWYRAGQLEASGETMYTTGTITMLFNSSISWSAHKPTVAPRQPCDAEVLAQADAMDSLVWLDRITKELGVHDNDGHAHLLSDWDRRCNFGEDGCGKIIPKAVMDRYSFIQPHLAQDDFCFIKRESNEDIGDGHYAELVTEPLATLQHRLMCKKIGLVARP